MLTAVVRLAHGHKLASEWKKGLTAEADCRPPSPAFSLPLTHASFVLRTCHRARRIAAIFPFTRTCTVLYCRGSRAARQPFIRTHQSRSTYCRSGSFSRPSKSALPLTGYTVPCISIHPLDQFHRFPKRKDCCSLASSLNKSSKETWQKIYQDPDVQR